MSALTATPAAEKAEIDLETIDTQVLIDELEARGHDVDNEPDLDSYSDEDLVTELQERGMGDAPHGTRQSIVEMYEAFYLGKNETAIAIARRIAQDTTGRTLP
jgi:hypothetical protein